MILANQRRYFGLLYSYYSALDFCKVSLVALVPVAYGCDWRQGHKNGLITGKECFIAGCLCVDRQFRQNDSKRWLVSGRDSIENRRRRPLVREPFRVAVSPQPWGARSALLRPVYGPYIGRASLYGQIDNAFAHDLLRRRAAVGRPKGRHRLRWSTTPCRRCRNLSSFIAPALSLAERKSWRARWTGRVSYL